VFDVAHIMSIYIISLILFSTLLCCCTNSIINNSDPESDLQVKAVNQTVDITIMQCHTLISEMSPKLGLEQVTSCDAGECVRHILAHSKSDIAT